MRLRTSAAAITAALLTLSLTAAAPGGRDAGRQTGRAAQGPADYVQIAEKQLTQPRFPETVRHVVELPSWDGAELHLEIVRPDPKVYPELDDLPVILEASPYHGTIADRDGTRIFPDPVDDEGDAIGLTGFFAPRGYAVAMLDLRGTGQSAGCLDHLGPNDALDLKHAVEWLAKRSWSNGRVGMTGHSYVGSTPSVAAAMRPQGLVTIVPSAGLVSMYDHQFQAGVPYNLQWVGPMAAYEALALDADLPPGTPSVLGDQTGDDFGNHPEDFGCGLPQSALFAGTGQVTGQYQGWHAERDWRGQAAAADIPVFMIHGVNDNAARIPAAEWFFGRRFARPGDKVWIGQWDHGSTNGRCGDPDGERVLHPTCRFDQFQEALHAWFDKHLMQRKVDTGPAVEAFLNGEAATALNQVVDPATEAWGRSVYVADAWRRPSAHLGLFPDAATGTLGIDAAPAEEATVSFGNGANAVIAHVGAGSVAFVSEPVAEDTVVLGLPDVDLDVSLTSGQLTHLTAILYRQDGDGNRQPMVTCAIQPQLRDGIDTVTPVVPGERMSLQPACFTMAHLVPAGQQLVFEVATRSPHHATFGGSDQQITVYTGPDATRLSLPVVPDARVHADVPLRREG